MFFFLALASCAQEKLPGAEDAPVPPDRLARVGAWELGVADLALLMPDPALRVPWLSGWVDAALVAQHLQESHPEEARAVERGVLGRALLEQLQKDAAEPPPTSAESARELARLGTTEEHPWAVRAVDLFVPVGPVEEERRAYRALLEIRAVCEGAASAYDFAERATTRARELEVRAQIKLLPPFSVEGRVVPLRAGDDPQLKLPSELVAVLKDLSEPGDLSSILATAQGFHLLYAYEIHPERRLSPEKRARLVRPLVLATRVAPTYAELGRSLRASTLLRIAPNASNLTKRAWPKD